MQAEAGERGDADDGRWRVAIERRRLDILDLLGKRNGGEDVIEPLQSFFDPCIVAVHPEGESDDDARDDDGNPSALPELLEDDDDQNAHAHHESGAVDGELALPARLLRAVVYPVARHAELRE